MIYSLSTPLRFGKYRGLTVEAISRFDARYLTWAVDKLDAFDLDPDAREVVGPAARKERQFALNQQTAWAWGFGADARRSRRNRDAKLVRIEFEERRKAGQESFIDACGQVQWRPALATEAQRAETENTGSVHDGAGPQGQRPGEVL